MPLNILTSYRSLRGQSQPTMLEWDLEIYKARWEAFGWQVLIPNCLQLMKPPAGPAGRRHCRRRNSSTPMRPEVSHSGTECAPAPTLCRRLAAWRALVWTGVHLAQGPPAEWGKLAHIACAVDLGPSSEGALDWASRLAQEFKSSLSLIHVVPRLDSPGEDITPMNTIRK
jgi:hypothetical protein